MTGSGVTPDGWQPAFPGQRPPFERGNLVGLRHGAFSQRLLAPLAEAIAQEQLERQDCPLWLKDPSYSRALMAWARAEAELVRLYARQDELEHLAGDEDPVDAALTDVTETEETENRPAMGSLTRVSVMRQRESLAKAIHRSETRARSLRADLGLTPASRARLGRDITNTGRLDLALYYASLAEEQEQERAADVAG